MHGVDEQDEIAHWREQTGKWRDIEATLNAANVPLAYMDTEPLSTVQRIALLVRDRDEARKLAADAQAANGRLMRDNRTLRGEKHPHAPDVCPSCSWANIGLMNYGKTKASIWLCHGCAAIRVQRLAKYERVIDAARDLRYHECIIDDANCAAGDHDDCGLREKRSLLDASVDALDAEDGQ